MAFIKISKNKLINSLMEKMEKILIERGKQDLTLEYFTLKNLERYQDSIFFKIKILFRIQTKPKLKYKYSLEEHKKIRNDPNSFKELYKTTQLSEGFSYPSSDWFVTLKNCRNLLNLALLNDKNCIVLTEKDLDECQLRYNNIVEKSDEILNYSDETIKTYFQVDQICNDQSWQLFEKYLKELDERK
jgi:hypothetical protein